MTASDESLPRTAASSVPTAAEDTVNRDLTLYNHGLAVGVLGGAVTSVALPSLALITLRSTPLEMSVPPALDDIRPEVPQRTRRRRARPRGRSRPVDGRRGGRHGRGIPRAGPLPRPTPSSHTGRHRRVTVVWTHPA